MKRICKSRALYGMVQGAYVLFISELELPSGKRIEYDG